MEQQKYLTGPGSTASYRNQDIALLVQCHQSPVWPPATHLTLNSGSGIVPLAVAKLFRGQFDTGVNSYRRKPARVNV